MVFNVLLLTLQVFLLALLVLKELIRRGPKNLVAVLLFTAHLVLVQGQAIYVLSDLARTGEPVFYADNVIHFRSFTAANMALSASAVVIYVSFHLVRQRRATAGAARWPELQETFFSYLTVIGLVLSVSCVLILKLGGFRSFYYSMGVVVGGQVLLMILLSIGKLPLFHKIVAGGKPNAVDWLLFCLVGFLIMLNSRGTAVLIALQYGVLNYFSRDIDRNPIRILVSVCVVGLLIVVVYGGIRDFVVPRGTFDGLVEYYFASAGASGMRVWAVGDLCYRFMVSTFTGLAGILDTHLASGVDHDFGITNLCLFTHLVPYQFRAALLGDIEEWICSFYSVSGSVVPGGYESWFVHLGFPGILIFAVALGMLPRYLHNRIVSGSADRLKYAVLSVHVLNLLLAPLWLVLFWGLADLCMLAVYRVLLSAGLHFDPGGARGNR